MLQLTRPLTAQLEITDKCNFRCGHCYHLDFNCETDSKDLPDERVMQIAAKMAENRIFSVVITGGEPLVRKGLVKSLVKYFKGENMEISLNTNLQLIDPETLEDFKASRISMLVSCPSSNPEIYSDMTGGGDFFGFLFKLKMALEQKQYCAVNMVVNRRNFGCIRETAKCMRDLGVKNFGATPMGLNIENPDTKDLLTLPEVRTLIEELAWIQKNLGLKVDIFEAIPKCSFPLWARNKDFQFLNHNCQAGKTTVSVANNGDVRPCSHDSEVYGNILEEDLSSIWRKMGRWRNFQNIPDRCTTCKLLPRCNGGCRINAKACTGDCRGEDPWMDFLNVPGEWLSETISEVSLDPEMFVTFAKTFRWRLEDEGNYLITSTNSNRNLIAVNRQLFDFVDHLRKITPLKLEDLAKRVQSNLADPGFKYVISLLTTKDFISLGSKKGGDSNGKNV